MNFLAHYFLSPEDDQIALGNFIADAVKGKEFEKYNDKIKNGILLHREIDNYTDKHLVFRRSTQILNSKYKKYSGVIIDIYYDHFLAKNWKDYSKTDLVDFVSQAYKILIKNYFILPKKIKRILPFMIAQNWLVGYANLNDLQRVFNGMARRTTFDSGMENAIFDLKNNYTTFENDFREFFPDLIEFCKNQIISPKN